MKLNDFKNMKHTQGDCPCCYSQRSVLFDEFHGETFCAKCGLVLHSTTRNSVVEFIEEASKKSKKR